MNYSVSFGLKLASLVVLLQLVNGQWDYRQQKEWPRRYRECSGKRQSPININWDWAIPNLDLNLKLHNYGRDVHGYEVVNNDHSIQFTYRGAPQQAPCLTGSAVHGHRFVLEQFHFHWGLKNGKGSEHKVEGHEFDAELHLVHYNRDKFPNFDKALEAREKAVTVLAVFYKVQKEKVPELKVLQHIVKKLQNRGKNETFAVEVPIRLNDFLPDVYWDADMPIYQYSGSLTTPPCVQGVNWLLMGIPKAIDAKEMKAFRGVRNTHESVAEGNNHRRVQSLNGRRIQVFPL